MPSMREYRFAPADSRRRGLPAIGVRVRIPERVEVTPLASGSIVVRCHEDGIGELAIELFAAGLIMNRDGILERMTDHAADAAIASPADGEVRSLMPVELAAGPSGFVAEIDLRRDDHGQRPALPYLTLFVLAPPDLAVAGGAIVTVRSKALDWPAAAEMLASLQLGALDGDDVAANDGRPAMPLLTRRR
jgi:hypothetical protein